MFKVGQKVVYVHFKIVDHVYGHTTPDLRAVYTVRAIGFAAHIPAIWLEEIHNTPRAWRDGVYELGMNSSYFRPLVEGKTEVSFTIGANPESEQWDNRANQTVRA